MRLEAYTVGFDPRNYHAPIPDNYSQEEILERRKANIRENIIRYLGEYRLGVKYDEFHYNFEQDAESGDFFLSSPHADPGPILNIYRKAISYKEERGLPIDREVAECLGFQKLQEGLADAQEGTLILWVSPPGPKADGYGDHSFTFIGQVVKDPEGEKRLRIIPYRNVLSFEEHKEYLKYFNKDAQFFNKDTHFLANPVIIEQSEAIQTPDDIISFIGETERFNIEWRNKLTPLIMPLIGGFIQLVREKASNGELNRTRNAIENYVISIRPHLLNQETTERNNINIEQTDVIFDKFGREAPPIAYGSCGSSATTLMEFHENSEKNWEYSHGDCVVCGEKNTMVGPCKICKSCEKTFDKQDSLQLKSA